MDEKMQDGLPQVTTVEAAQERQDIVTTLNDVLRNHKGFRVWGTLNMILMIGGALISAVLGFVIGQLILGFFASESDMNAGFGLFVGAMVFAMLFVPHLVILNRADAVVTWVILQGRAITMIDDELRPLLYDAKRLHFYRKYISDWLLKKPGMMVSGGIAGAAGFFVLILLLLVLGGAACELWEIPPFLYGALLPVGIGLLIALGFYFISGITLKGKDLQQVLDRRALEEAAAERERRKAIEEGRIDPAAEVEAVQKSKTAKAASPSGLRTLIKVILIIATIPMAVTIIPLFWCVPMIRHYSEKSRRGEPVSTGFKLACFFFISFLGGILMFCDKD